MKSILIFTLLLNSVFTSANRNRIRNPNGSFKIANTFPFANEVAEYVGLDDETLHFSNFSLLSKIIKKNPLKLKEINVKSRLRIINALLIENALSEAFSMIETFTVEDARKIFKHAPLKVLLFIMSSQNPESNIFKIKTEILNKSLNDICVLNRFDYIQYLTGQINNQMTSEERRSWESVLTFAILKNKFEVVETLFQKGISTSFSILTQLLSPTNVETVSLVCKTIQPTTEMVQNFFDHILFQKSGLFSTRGPLVFVEPYEFGERYISAYEAIGNLIGYFIKSDPNLTLNKKLPIGHFKTMFGEAHEIEDLREINLSLYYELNREKFQKNSDYEFNTAQIYFRKIFIDRFGDRLKALGRGLLTELTKDEIRAAFLNNTVQYSLFLDSGKWIESIRNKKNISLPENDSLEEIKNDEEFYLCLNSIIRKTSPFGRQSLYEYITFQSSVKTEPSNYDNINYKLISEGRMVEKGGRWDNELRLPRVKKCSELKKLLSTEINFDYTLA